MLKGMSVFMVLVGLSLMSIGAQADHRHHYRGDRELAYLIGGVLVGAAVGGLIYSDRHAYGYPRYAPRVAGYYGAPRRFYRPNPPGHLRHKRPGRHHPRHYRRW